MQTVTGGTVTAIAAAIRAVIGWFFRGRLRWLRPRPDPGVKDRIKRQVARRLGELQKGPAAPPAGTPPIDTKALAAQATPEAAKLLAEALALHRQHKERDAIERLLAAYDMEMPPEANAALYILAGNGFLRLSDLPAAESQYRLGLAAAAEADDQQGRAAALGNLGNVYYRRGDLDEAEEHHKRALAIDEEIGNKLGQAQDLGNLGSVHADRGDIDKAEEHYRKALALFEEVGTELRVAQTQRLLQQLRVRNL